MLHMSILEMCNMFNVISQTKVSSSNFHFDSIPKFPTSFFFHFPFQETLHELQSIAPKTIDDTLEKLTSFGYAIQSSDETSVIKTTLPDFPTDNLKLIARLSEANPSQTPYDLIYRLYPYESFLPAESHGVLLSLFDSLKIATPSAERKSSSWIDSLKMSSSANKGQKITSIERPTRSKVLLESTDDGGGISSQFHKGMNARTSPFSNTRKKLILHSLGSQNRRRFW